MNIDPHALATETRPHDQVAIALLETLREAKLPELETRLIKAVRDSGNLSEPLSKAFTS